MLNETFYVIDSPNKNLLSGKAAIMLGILNLTKPVYCIDDNKQPDLNNPREINDDILKINHEKDLKMNNSDYKQYNSSSVPETESEITAVPNRIKPIIKSFEESVFSGKVGKLKGHQVKLHIDKTVPPLNK